MQLQRLTFIVVFALATAASAQTEAIKAMTFNIRFASAEDGDNSWPHRSELLFKVIRDFDPDVLGVQEAQRIQIDQLAAALPGYNNVGVGRDPDGGGEYSAIYFRRDRFDLSDAGTQWLSDTPDKPGSHTWGNNLPRIFTSARLFDRRTERRFTVINTHWDHESQPARLNSGKMLAKRIDKLVERKEPVLVMGDFNSGIENPATSALTSDGELLFDTLLRFKPDEKSLSTFNGFGKLPRSPKIDAILATEGWQVDDAAIVRTNDNGRYPSDHFPVTATVTLENDKP